MRLLQPVAAVRDEGDGASDPILDNLLIRGDALHVLTSLVALPDYAAEYGGRVRLAYLDPPFNTGNAFAHYADALEHSVWLTMIRDRLRLIRELLAPDGSVWVHPDDTEVHRCRAVLDELFGAENFVATVIWEKADSPRMDAQWFSTRHDFLLVYGKTPGVLVNGFDYRPHEAAHYNKVDAEGRRLPQAPPGDGRPRVDPRRSSDALVRA